MSDYTFATKELAKLLGVLAHPERIRIVEELRNGEFDVNSLQKEVRCAHARVSQNLSILRSHGIVAHRRDGRHVFYHPVEPGVAGWVAEGLQFLERTAPMNDETRSALHQAREQWSGPFTTS